MPLVKVRLVHIDTKLNVVNEEFIPNFKKRSLMDLGKWMT